MATSRPFAYNPTFITSGVSEQYGTLSVGFQDQPYGESPSGLKWWEGPDEDLGYCIGKSLPSGGRLGPDGIYGDVTFWRTQTLSDSQFITLANRITGQNFNSSLEAVTWLNDNGYWTSYAGVPATTPTSTPTATAVPVIGAWSVGGSLITARYGLAGAGTQNEALAFGGCSPTTVSCTEEYDGATWSTGGSLINTRASLAGSGTQNAGLAFGGSYGPFSIKLSCTEEYNGSSWSSGGALITTRQNLAGAGTQNAGLAFGGFSPSTVSCTEAYDGSTWSTGGALITARYNLAGAGTQNEGLAFGGFVTFNALSCTEEYNGSSWSTGGALITKRYGLAGAGTQNAGLAFGGCNPPFPSILSCTEEYNGSSWSTGGALITPNCGQAGAGTQNAGLAFGGRLGGPSPALSCTEEYNDSPSVTPTSTTTSTPTPTSTIALTPTNTATPSPTPYPTIYTHGSVRATCSDFCTTNYNITTLTSASDTYTGLAIGDFIYGISGAGFIAYSNVSTDTTTGPFRIAEIDSNGEVIAIFICNGVTCEPL